MQAITKLFSDIINDIANKNPNQRYELDINQVKSDVEYLISAQVELKHLVITSFKLHELSDEEILDFFGSLEYLSYEIEILGRFSAAALLIVFTEIGQKHAQNILKTTVGNESRRLWQLIYLLPDFLSIYKLEHEFVINWFVEIHRKVNNDMMSYLFYIAFANYVLAFPHDGEEIVRHYLRRTDDSDLKQIAGIALGALRVASSRSGQHQIIQDLEHQLKSSTRVEYRELYLLSWITTYKQGDLGFDDILEIITEDKSQTAEEFSAKSFLIYHIFAKGIDDLAQINQLLNELCKIVDFMPTNSVKHWVLKIVMRLQLEIRDSTTTSFLLLLFEKILPIEVDQKVLWNLIEFLLLESQKCNHSLFENYFDKLLQKAPIELIELLKNHELKSTGYQLSKSMDDNKIGSMLFSDQRIKRKFVLILVRDYNLRAQNLQNFEPRCEVLSDLLIDIATDYFSESVSDLLLMVEPLFSKTSKQVKDDFIELMLYQGMNLPGTCFYKWREIESKSETIEIVCSMLDYYFSRLAETADIFPQKFVYYLFADAAQQKRIRDSRELSSQVQEKSIFLSLIKPTTILYSKQYAFFDSEGKAKVQNLKPIGHSIEYPRMELLDPEGAVNYRLNCQTRYRDKTRGEKR